MLVCWCAGVCAGVLVCVLCTAYCVCCVCASICPKLDSHVPHSCEELQLEVRRVMQELREEVNAREAVSNDTCSPPRTLLFLIDSFNLSDLFIAYLRTVCNGDRVKEECFLTTSSSSSSHSPFTPSPLLTHTQTHTQPPLQDLLSFITETRDRKLKLLTRQSEDHTQIVEAAGKVCNVERAPLA